MNTAELKKFAQAARRKLLEQVGSKLSFVLTADSPELREKTQQIKQLREELNKTTKEQLIEKVAYTWFNRLMALRFMDANDYQPLGIRIITPKDGYTSPELLDEAKRGNIPEELPVKRQRVFDLLDGKIPSTNPQNEAYKELLIAACNHLISVLPFLFEKINDYTELLLPDDLTSDFSIVTDIRNGMVIDDCKNVEIIGWLYQFYISEKKDEVFASKSKVKKEDIPAATQLFTPRWIIEYMVQNTLGKLWLQNRPKSPLREHMPYFIESASLKADEYLKIQSPEEIKFLDPASGSGHILVYAFDLFTKIYEEEGYNTFEIPQLIIEKNLYGFEIDERAAQLSGLALMMKAREYQRNVFRKGLTPNIIYFNDLQVTREEIKELITSQQINISKELMRDLLTTQQATNLGSLIIPHSEIAEIKGVIERLSQFLPKADVFQQRNVEATIGSLNQLMQLAQKYHCVVTNPPYMGGGNMNPALAEFAKNNYPDSKLDLMACFMESGLEMLHNKGFLGMINMHSWMFLGSYKNLREKFIQSKCIDTLLHLGSRTFPEIGGEVVQNASFTFYKGSKIEKCIYLRLVDFDTSDLKRIKTIEAINNNSCGFNYEFLTENFKYIPSYRIGYWLPKKIIEVFEKSESLGEHAVLKAGLQTGNNDRYVRNWWELSSNNFRIFNNKARFVPYDKGGAKRKWFGNQQFALDWLDDGEYLKNNKISVFRNSDFYFKEGLSYSLTNTSSIGFRYKGNEFVFDNQGSSLFTDKGLLYYILGYTNSNIVAYLSKLLNPTMVIQVGDLSELPIMFENSRSKEIEELVSDNIEISRSDWNLQETSWHFNQNLLVRKTKDDEADLSEGIDLYYQYQQNRFLKLHKNEEKINCLFLRIFDLKDEISPEVALDEITILQDEINEQLLTELSKKIIRDPFSHTINNYQELSLPFMTKEVITKLLSYAVGCMFGRYSLDKEGLILANQGETLQDYLQKIDKSEHDCSFLPDKDNIIPILEDEWFEDDIVGKFCQFLKVTFGEKNFNKNLAFIEEQIDKDIRKYFLKDFYPDHIKRYKKRPIYWMFSSPKGSFNVLIYMHRYTPDTLSNILNKYLKEFIGKLNARKEHLQHVQVTGSASDKTKAIKEIGKIDKMLVELHEYERDILYPLATERIEIDLDDGVLVNYNKFGRAVKEVNGLNDPATKKKVKQFDWIDTSQIR